MLISDRSVRFVFQFEKDSRVCLAQTNFLILVIINQCIKEVLFFSNFAGVCDLDKRSGRQIYVNFVLLVFTEKSNK